MTSGITVLCPCETKKTLEIVEMLTVLKPGRIPEMPPHAWFGTCSLCKCHLRVDDADEHIGPPLPPMMYGCGIEEPLRDPRVEGYDDKMLINVKCPTERCGRFVQCIRRALKK